MPSLVAESQFHVPDYVMLFGYFVLMLGIGAYFYRYMRGMKMYFTGGNKIPWWLAGVSFYMSSFSAYAFVIFSGLCFRIGWVGITLFWVAVPATIFSVMLFSTRWRRARTVSPIEFLETRYSGLVRQTFAWATVPVGLMDDSLKLIATATIVRVVLQIPIVHGIWLCGVIMVAYTFMGGLWAVTVADFVQFAILAVAVLALFPMALAKVGGLTGLVAHAPDGFFAFTNEKYNWFYFAMLIGLYCITWSSTHWHLIQKYFCVATERDAKKVGLLVAVMYIIGPPLILLPAIAAQQFLPTDTPDTDVYPQICKTLLPVGMLGLVIAAMFSSTMGNLSSHFNVWASVLTNDVYRRLFNPHAGEKTLVAVGRAMTVVVGALTVVCAIALSSANAEGLFKYMVTLFGTVVAPLGIPMLLGLVTRRINTRSVLAEMLANVIVIPVLFFTLPGQGHLKIGQTFDVLWQKESVIFGASTLLTLLVLYIVSALLPTQEEEKRRVEAFHKRLETPIGQLPEDHPADEHSEQVFSPFGIVGICLAIIGVLMLVIDPWIDDRLGMLLNAILGTALLVIGLLMTWGSKRARVRAKQAASAAALASQSE